MNIAHQIVDILLDEGWWGDLKTSLGFGQDSFGLGKNTEPGWTPSYGRRVAARTPEDEERLRKKRNDLILRRWLEKGKPKDKDSWELD